MQRRINPLMNLCMPLFDVLGLIRSEAALSLPEDLADTLYQNMKTLEHEAVENQIPGQVVTEVQYAMAALIDEAIMLSQWPGRFHWADRSLQFRLFGEHLAGVNFFVRLEKIRQSGENNLSLLEVYYVCLQLGFQGKYALSQQEELKSMQVDIKNQIDLYRGPLSPRLSNDLEPAPHFTGLSLMNIKPWMIFASAAVILGLLYGFYWARILGVERKHAPLIEALRSERS
jgi:type VI secretion system protein ImpK